MRNLTRAFASAVAAVGILAGSITAANAQGQTIKDKRADVVKFDKPGDSTPTRLNKSRSAKSGIDIREMKVSYSKKALTIKVTTAKLAKSNVAFIGEVRIKGSKRGYYVGTIGSSKKALVFDLRTGEEPCSGTVRRKSGKNGSITVSVKRSCLKAKVVRARAALNRDLDPKDPASAYLVDWLSPKHTKKPSYSKWLKVS